MQNNSLDCAARLRDGAGPATMTGVAWYGQVSRPRPFLQPEALAPFVQSPHDRNGMANLCRSPAPAGVREEALERPQAAPLRRGLLSPRLAPPGGGMEPPGGRNCGELCRWAPERCRVEGSEPEGRLGRRLGRASRSC